MTDNAKKTTATVIPTMRLRKRREHNALSTRISMTLTIPERLAATCRKTPERRAWLAELPNGVRKLQDKWSLSLGAPFDCDEISCAWVAPAIRKDNTHAVLKLGMPHMEGAHEIQALRFWQGDPTVRVLEADEDLNAMLLERCTPGTALRQLSESEQDVVTAGLLRRLWRMPSAPHPFRPLCAMMAHWSNETLADDEKWPDAGLVREGLRLFKELSRPSPHDVLLATDLHAGNILRAQREPWLVIDPKPFIGDAAYDATQHLLDCEVRLRDAPDTTIRRFSDLLGIDHERARLWMFARSAAESRDIWDDNSMALARVLS